MKMMGMNLLVKRVILFKEDILPLASLGSSSSFSIFSQAEVIQGEKLRYNTLFLSWEFGPCFKFSLLSFSIFWFSSYPFHIFTIFYFIFIIPVLENMRIVVNDLSVI